MGCGVLNGVIRLDPPLAPPPAAALQLWFLDVKGAEPGESAGGEGEELDVSVLDEQERARAARMRGEDRSTFLAAHVLLRRLLAELLGVEPQDIAYRREPCPWCGSPRGRPALQRPSRPLHFSLSRRAGVVMIAIASAQVGVDIEALPTDATVSEVAELLHPAEREEILSAPHATRAAIFARVWTRKEAYLKGVGIGVGHGLDRDYLGTQERAPGPVGWAVIDVPVAAGYGAAVAVRGTGAPSRHASAPAFR
jgi:4'-phosphopantetheinyl transferase